MSAKGEAITVYNRISSVQNLLTLMKVTANAEDKAYLAKLEAQIGSLKLPEAKILGNSVVLVDGNSVYKFQDLGGGRYRYSGKEFSVDMNQSIQKNVELIEIALGLKSQASLRSILIPEARALGPAAAIAVGIYALGGIATYVGCGWFGDSGLFHHDPACAALAITWPAVALVAGLMWATSAVAKAAEVPKKVDCGEKKSDSRTVTITKADNTTVVIEAKGQEFKSTPVPPADRIGPAKKAFAAIQQLCENPEKVSSLNKALADYNARAASAPTIKGKTISH